MPGLAHVSVTTPAPPELDEHAAGERVTSAPTTKSEGRAIEEMNATRMKTPYSAEGDRRLRFNVASGACFYGGS